MVQIVNEEGFARQPSVNQSSKKPVRSHSYDKLYALTYIMYVYIILLFLDYRLAVYATTYQ